MKQMLLLSLVLVLAACYSNQSKVDSSFSGIWVGRAYKSVLVDGKEDAHLSVEKNEIFGFEVAKNSNVYILRYNNRQLIGVATQSGKIFLRKAFVENTLPEDEIAFSLAHAKELNFKRDRKSKDKLSLEAKGTDKEGLEKSVSEVQLRGWYLYRARGNYQNVKTLLEKNVVKEPAQSVPTQLNEAY